MSEVKVNKISPRSGTTFTIGDSGDTVTTAGNISALNITATNSLTVNGGAITASTNPTITSISPETITNTQTAITITGANYISIPTVDAILTTGAIVPADTVTFNNSTSLTCNFTLPTDGTYYIRIENNDGLAVRSSTALLTVSDAPVWTTASGTLGTIAGDFSGTVATVAATGDSTLAYSETTNVLTNAAQANCSLNSATGVITTTDFGGSSTTATTYTFTLRVTDAEGQTADRAFTLTSSYGATGGGQFN
jgi:hypothetical protein